MTHKNNEYKFDNSNKVADSTSLVDSFNEGAPDNQQANFMGKLFNWLVPFVGWFRPLFKRRVIPAGQFGLSKVSGVPKLYKPGVYYFAAFNESFEGTFSLTEKSKSVISLNGKTLVKVREGEMGGVYRLNGSYVLLDTGIHLLDNMQYREPSVVKRYDARASNNKSDERLDAKDIKPQTLGPLTVVTILDGEKGIVNKNGRVEILEPGWYILSADTKYLESVSMKMRVHELKEIEIVTSDGIDMTVRGLLTYQVSDAKKAITEVDNFTRNIQDLADQTLSSTCRSYAREDLSPANSSRTEETRVTVLEEKHNSQSPSTSTNNRENSNSQFTVHEKVKSIYQQIRLECLNSLKELASKMGLTVHSVNIESFTVKDKRMRENMSRIALARIEATAAGAEATVTKTKAQATADSSRLETDATAYQIETLAKANAGAKVIEANADKDAMQKRDEGYKDLSPLGQQLAVEQLAVQKLDKLGPTIVDTQSLGALLTTGMFANTRAVVTQLNRESSNLQVMHSN